MRPWRWIPNILSLSRPLVGVPLIYFLVPYQKFSWALLVFIISAGTDWLDGWYARKYGAVSISGQLLDPLCDKIFFIGAVFILKIPLEAIIWFLLLLILEITLVVIGAIGFFLQPRVGLGIISLGANSWGKMKFVSEFVFVLLLFAHELGIDTSVIISREVEIDASLFMLWFAIILALLSIGGHLKKI